MTTTKKANGNQPSKAPPEVEAEWEGAGQASGGGESDAPAWLPHLTKFRDDVIARKLEAQPAGSHSAPVLVGALTVQQAFGEPRYFMDAATPEGKPVRMALPLHGALTSALDRIALTPAPKVRLGFLGEAPRARPGQNAAFLYDIRVLPKTALLPEARADALLPIHKANKAKRDAAKRAAEAAGADLPADPRGDDE